MPRRVELDLSQLHCYCYVCKREVPERIIVSHWRSAGHKKTHGEIDFNRMPAHSLIDAKAIQRTAVTWREVSNEQLLWVQEEDEQVGSLQKDEDFVDAGTCGCCLMILISLRPSYRPRQTLQTPQSRQKRGISITAARKHIPSI
jgi:hypothetical protein